MSDRIPGPDPLLAQTGYASLDREERERDHGAPPVIDEQQVEEDRAHDISGAVADPSMGNTPAEKAEIEDTAVDKVVERLEEKFPDVPAAVVQETVAEIHESLDDAVVRDFVPRIVEHEAREKLRDIDGDAAEGSAPDAHPAP